MTGSHASSGRPSGRSVIERAGFSHLGVRDVRQTFAGSDLVDATFQEIEDRGLIHQFLHAITAKPRSDFHMPTRGDGRAVGQWGACDNEPRESRPRSRTS